MLKSTTFVGLRIIEDSTMVIDGEPIKVVRSWKERIFSLPWRPLKRAKIVVSKVPNPNVYRYKDYMVMHPDIAKQLREHIKDNYNEQK